MWGLRINESIIDLNISGGAEVEMGIEAPSPPGWRTLPSGVTDPPLWGDGPSPLVGAHPTSRSSLPKGFPPLVRWDRPKGDMAPLSSMGTLIISGQ